MQKRKAGKTEILTCNSLSGYAGCMQDLRVALPSSTNPCRMSSNKAKLSAVGLSRQGLGCLFFLQHMIQGVMAKGAGRPGGTPRQPCSKSVGEPEQHALQISTSLQHSLSNSGDCGCLCKTGFRMSILYSGCTDHGNHEASHRR